MKIITLNGKQYNMPTSWDEVTLKQQIQVSRDTDLIDIPEMKKLAIISGYANIPLVELKRAQLTELTELFKGISFINTPIPDKMLIEFNFNGHTYYTGQVLLESQFQDYISIQNALAEASGNTYTALPFIIAVMAKRKKENGLLESLDEYDVMARAKEFENIPIAIANGIALFFYRNINISKIPFQLYSQREQIVRESIQKARKSLKNIQRQRGGRGFLILWLRGMLLSYLRFTEKSWLRFYTSTAPKFSTTKWWQIWKKSHMKKQGKKAKTKRNN